MVVFFVGYVRVKPTLWRCNGKVTAFCNYALTL
jgi:hypothetical protein